MPTRPPPRLHLIEPRRAEARTAAGWLDVTVFGVLGSHLVLSWGSGPRAGTLGWVKAELLREGERIASLAS